MLECESGSGFGSCSVWIWHGSAYSAIWSNGAIGQLTVASGASVELRVQRVDTSGAGAGLTATYTGKWDGASVKDGKLSFTFKGAAGEGTWTGTPTLTPVLSKSNEANLPFVNWYTAELTGFAMYSNGQNAFGNGIRGNDFRMRGEPPMKPGESRLFTLRSNQIVTKNVSSAAYKNNDAIAAIYSDGVTFGDPNVLATMLANRRSMIATLARIGSTVCTLGSQQASIADIVTALDKQHAEQDARFAANKDERDATYAYMSKSLGSRANNRLPSSQAIKRTFDQLNQLRSGLSADPVKDAYGQLAIPPVAPLQCGLP